MTEINTVNVFSIDEEKLKFKVSISIAGANIIVDEGVYQVLLPIPTALANSFEYETCLINCTGFQAYATGAVADPAFTVDVGGGALLKAGCIEIQLDIPSSQTITSTQSGAAAQGIGDSRIGGYRELLFLECHSVGDGAGNTALTGRSAAWTGKNTSQPILCGNPFGKTITIRTHDAMNDARCYLVSAAAGAGSADVGHYLFSFDITMVKSNK